MIKSAKSLKILFKFSNWKKVANDKKKISAFCKTITKMFIKDKTTLFFKNKAEAFRKNYSIISAKPFKKCKTFFKK